jgi:hypothetical protein
MEEMGSSFDADLSKVRIHQDPSAVQMNNELGAQAFTTGNDIYFNQGKYDTGSKDGQHLLAHELTHVEQQGQHSTPSIQKDEKDDAQKQLGDFYEMIPTARLKITLNGLEFTVADNATFRPGATRPQVLEIVLKKLLGARYQESYVKALEQVLAANSNIKGVGTLGQKSKNVLQQPIGAITILPEAFLLMTKFFQARHLTLELSPDEVKQIVTATFNVDLWNDFIKIAAQEGVRLPAWYSRLFFNGQMTAHMQLLEEYQQVVQSDHTDQDATSATHRLDKVTQIFYTLETDIALLEAIRKDVTLQINPSTQLPYFYIWAGNKDKGVGTVPAILRTMDAAFKLINFAQQNQEIARDAENDNVARTRLLELFAKAVDIEKEKNLQVLQPFPSFISNNDLNPDNTTITTAKNKFRMNTDFSGIHGNNLPHGVTIAMQMRLFNSWQIFRMPASLKKLGEMGINPPEMVQATDDFVKNSPDNLGELVDSYKPEEKKDRDIKMSDLGIGEFVLAGLAVPHYNKDMDMVQKPSTAGYPLFVYSAEDLAKKSAFSDVNQAKRLKEEAAKTDDPDKKKALEAQAHDLDEREKMDLRAVTEKDLSDTMTLLDNARELKGWIEYDQKYYGPDTYYGNKTTDPFSMRLKHHKAILYDVYQLAREAYPANKYSDLDAATRYRDDVIKQAQDLEHLQDRSKDAYGRFKPGSPTYRTAVGLVKEDDGNLVPLIMVAGYHPDADPANGKFKMKLVDVTFKSPHPGDMIYVSDTFGSESEAITDLFHNFAGHHKYGDGKFVYRLPNTNYQGTVESWTPISTYLEYAIAALGLVLLVAGVIASAGALTPAAAAVVSALGVAVGVVGAIMSIRHMQERKEKGVLELDADTALDILNIIAGVVVAVGAVTKLTQVVTKSVNLLMLIEKFKGGLMVYDAVNIAANAFLIHEKVKEDTDAIKKMGLPKPEEDEMLSAVTFQALQQGAMLAVSAYSLGRGGLGHLKERAAGVSYHSWEERGWIREVNGKMTISAEAPPFLRSKMYLLNTEPVKTNKPGEPPTTKPPVDTTTGKTGTGDTDTTTGKTGTGDTDTTTGKTGTTDTDTTDTGTTDKTGSTPGEPGSGSKQTDTPPKPQTFDERMPSKWRDPKSRPGRLNDCVKKLRALGISDDKILAILNHAAEKAYNPSDVFGGLSIFLKNGQKQIGKARFDQIIDGLASASSFEGAAFLAVRQGTVNKQYKDPNLVGKIMDTFSLEDITQLWKRFPPKDPIMDGLQWRDNLELLATRIKGGRDEAFKLLGELGEGASGMDQLSSALKEIGPGLSTSERIRKQFAFEERLQKTLGVKGDEAVRELWQDHVKGKKDGKFEVAGSLQAGETPGDSARAYIDDNKKKIVRSLLNDAKTEVDPVKWGTLRYAVEQTDLLDIQKYNIIGELWAAAKVEAYTNQGYDVVREVTIDILDGNGKVVATTILDAVLKYRGSGEVAGYREFKSGGETPLEEGTQDVAYPRLKNGELSSLKPRGAHAEEAFGGPKMPNFKAGEVIEDRPGGLIQ